MTKEKAYSVVDRRFIIMEIEIRKTPSGYAESPLPFNQDNKRDAL